MGMEEGTLPNASLYFLDFAFELLYCFLSFSRFNLQRVELSCSTEFEFH